MPVVLFDDSDIQIDKVASGQLDRIVHNTNIEERDRADKTQLRAAFEIRSAMNTGILLSSAVSSGSSNSSTTHMFEATSRIATAKLNIFTPILSDDIRRQINALPPWDGSSERVKAQYDTFFGTHGTHVNVQAALGGVLRVLSSSSSNQDSERVVKALGVTADAPFAAQIGLSAQLSAMRRRSHGRRAAVARGLITVSRDGGRAVAKQLTGALEDLFAYARNPSGAMEPSPLQNWVKIRTQWIDALETDPAFCAGDRQTQYMWLYELDGLGPTQRADLEHASKWYLDNTTSLRKKNLEQVDNAITEVRVRWYRRFWRRVRFWRRSEEV
jgi:hypothetical protein